MITSEPEATVLLCRAIQLHLSLVLNQFLDFSTDTPEG